MRFVDEAGSRRRGDGDDRARRVKSRRVERNARFFFCLTRSARISSRSDTVGNTTVRCDRTPLAAQAGSGLGAIVGAYPDDPTLGSKSPAHQNWFRYGRPRCDPARGRAGRPAYRSVDADPGRRFPTLRRALYPLHACPQVPVKSLPMATSRERRSPPSPRHQGIAVPGGPPAGVPWGSGIPCGEILWLFSGMVRSRGDRDGNGFTRHRAVILGSRRRSRVAVHRAPPSCLDHYGMRTTAPARPRCR